MILPFGDTFTKICEALERAMTAAPRVDNQRWQGIDVSRDPSAAMFELHNVIFSIPLNGIEDLQHWRDDIRPNLPWADDHFQERVGGEPLNPGVQWERWPWASSADRHRTDQRFNHTYMERLWPMWAGYTEDGKLPVTTANESRRLPEQEEWVTVHPNKGIRNNYGDLQSLVELLVKDPFTRQAWIPLFFPEDTGIADGGRKPCTLGYQFLRRGNQLHIYYPLRSCDLVRHFRDDCYLAVRLGLWVIDQCRLKCSSWQGVGLGDYLMHCTSLHCFVNDLRSLKRCP